MKQLESFIQGRDHFLVVSHIRPDGDAIASTLAVGHVLKKLGKRVTMVNASPIPQKFTFLPGVGEIVHESQLQGEYKHIIAVDCADKERMGDVATYLSADAELLNIDHHQTNDHFGLVNIVDASASSTAEVIYRCLKATKMEWDCELATCIYTGILTDTGGFRYANTTAEVMQIASYLIQLGANPHTIADFALENKTKEQLALLQVALRSLQISSEGLAWMGLTYEMCQQESGEDGFDGIVNYARNIIGIEVGVLFQEIDVDQVKISFRSRHVIDVAEVASRWGGGGHARAAGCTYRGTLSAAEKEVIVYLKKLLERVAK